MATDRSRRDLVTNSAYDTLMGEMAEMAFTETERLKLDSRGPDQAQTNYQSGIVEGVQRALKRMATFRQAALDDTKGRE